MAHPLRGPTTCRIFFHFCPSFRMADSVVEERFRRFILFKRALLNSDGRKENFEMCVYISIELYVFQYR